MVAGKAASAAWRQAGLSYLQYLGIAGRVVRSALKEPAKSKAAAREGMFYNKAIGLGEKSAVSSLFPKQA
jgi:hypothetical protein